MKKSKKNIVKLLKSMTTEEKIGQLAQYNCNVAAVSTSEITGPMQSLNLDPEKIKVIGSVLNFKDAAEMRAVQDGHLAADRNRIPLLFMYDVIHGYRTVFPVPLGMGASFDPDLMAACTRMAAREASASGVMVTFTPMVDFVRDARWGRVMETCGEDVLLNGRMGAAQVRAVQGDDLSDPENIAACVKHFAAYGGAEAGRDYNQVEISERLLRECYLPAYKACLDAGARMIMPSFNSLNGLPSAANPFLMKRILKREWKFGGVVISDYNAIGEFLRHGITDSKKEACRLAFENGCDIEMMSSTYQNYLKELLDEGVFSEKQLDEAVLRVLKLKRDLGLFEDPYRGASPEKEAAVQLTPENRALARRAAAESAVLLKNDGILPLTGKEKKIALIGPLADSHRILGGWKARGVDEESVTVAEGMRAAFPDAEITVIRGCACLVNDRDGSGIPEAAEAAKNADAVILCVGELPEYSGEGNSRRDLCLPGMQEELVQAVCAANPRTAALVFSGRPLALEGLDRAAGAILEMWFPGTEGGNAAADLISGRSNPCGKLSMTFPRSVGQCPIYYNRTSTGRPNNRPDDTHKPYSSSYVEGGVRPLYCFGYGLSYTSFTCEALELDRGEIGADEQLTVSVTVRNDGERAGKETVQLYMRDPVASAVRPVQSLIGFEKVTLQPGESRTVTFTVTEPMLRFVGADCKWRSEPGEFILSTGYADHLILSKSFRLK